MARSVWDYMTYGIVWIVLWVCMGLYGIIWDNIMGLYGNIWDCMDLYGIICVQAENAWAGYVGVGITHTFQYKPM